MGPLIFSLTLLTATLCFIAFMATLYGFNFNDKHSTQVYFFSEARKVHLRTNLLVSSVVLRSFCCSLLCRFFFSNVMKILLTHF